MGEIDIELPALLDHIVEVRLTNVQALDLQETPSDEIFMGIGDERTNIVSFTEGQTREGSDVGNADQVTEFIAPNGFIGVSVFERDPLSSQQIGSFRVPCRPVATQRDVSGGGAFYRVSYVVTQLP